MTTEHKFTHGKRTFTSQEALDLYTASRAAKPAVKPDQPWLPWAKGLAWFVAGLFFINLLQGGKGNPPPATATVTSPTQDVPNCGRVADIAAALRAGNQQEASNLALNASGLDMQAARVGERSAIARFGPSEVRDSVLRACLQTAR